MERAKRVKGLKVRLTNLTGTQIIYILMDDYIMAFFIKNFTACFLPK